MIQRTEARQLSSRREWSLISSSLSPALQAHSAARLKSKISRARKLREKYQDLYRRQKLASKSMMAGTRYEKLNVRTFRKKQMFGEAINRLSQRLERVTAPVVPARTTTRVSRRKLKTTGPARTHSRRGQLASERRIKSLKSRAASPALPNTMKLRTAGYKRRQTHVAATGRRRQAKRDSQGRP
jgi:hypothetical protein